ncbi:MAG: hypothetical protein AAFY55_17730 [Bacteroidota bacterium]
MSIIETASAAFGLLEAGIRLSKSTTDGDLGISLKIKNLAVGKSRLDTGAALAFLVVTNNSDQPRSITDIILDWGTTRANRVPLVSLEPIDSFDSALNELDAKSHVYSALFYEVDPLFADLRILPDDIYLRPNESRSGCALFAFEEKAGVSAPLIIVEVGGLGVLSKSLWCNPRVEPVPKAIEVK